MFNILCRTKRNNSEALKEPRSLLGSFRASLRCRTMTLNGDIKLSLRHEHGKASGSGELS